VFEKHGFVPIADGDLWADGDPVIHMHAGAMLQPAIKQTVLDFALREGITPSNIRTVYNGCGVLVSQMKSGDRPDAFFACDAKYLDDPLKNDAPDGPKIKDLFLEPTTISKNKLVIMVPKGNPKKIRGLRDLTRKGMRIGVGDEHKCAMGALTDVTFRQGNIRGKVNIVVKAGTGDMLVNQMQADPNALDAVVVYVSNYNIVRDKFDSVDVDLDCAIATQPIAAGRESNHRHLIDRLIKAITSPDSKKRFEEYGFKWQATR
jgi:ABC-type molybdate transport system substrate-binding protein